MVRLSQDFVYTRRIRERNEPEASARDKERGDGGGVGGVGGVVVMRIRAKGRSHKNKPLGPPSFPSPPAKPPGAVGRPAPTPGPSPAPAAALFPAPGWRDAGGESPPAAPHAWGGIGGCGSTRPDRNSRSLSARARWAAVLPGALGGGVPHDHTLPNFSEFAKIVSKAVCGERAERERRVRAGGGGRGQGPARRDAAHAGRDTRGEGAASGGYLVRFAS